MIAVVGSANMDLVAYVPVSPKLGETVTGRDFRTVPGGKGANQALAAARAGAEVTFIGAVGDDEFGPRLRSTLADAGVDTEHLRTVPRSSGIAHIVVDDDGANSIIVVPGANGEVTLSEGDRRTIAAADALLVQLELPMPVVTDAARTAAAAGVPVMLTPAPVQSLPDELLTAVDLLVPNEHEAAAISGQADPHAALDALLRVVPEVAITLGSRGVLYGSRDDDPVFAEAPRVKAVDTTGAGDTFAGTLAVARAEGRAPADALGFACAAAALAVQREGAGTSMPARAEIDEALRS